MHSLMRITNRDFLKIQHDIETVQPSHTAIKALPKERAIASMLVAAIILFWLV